MRWEGESLSLNLYRLKGSLTHHRHGMRGTGLWWRCKLYTVGCSTAKCYSRDRDSYCCPQSQQPRALTNWAISPLPAREADEVLDEVLVWLTWDGTHDTEPTSLCPILIMLSAWLGSDKVTFLSHWFDSTRFRTRELWIPWSPNHRRILYSFGHLVWSTVL